MMIAFKTPPEHNARLDDKVEKVDSVSRSSSDSYSIDHT